MCHMGRHWDMYVVTVSCAGQHSSGGTSIRAEVGNVADTVVVSVMGTTQQCSTAGYSAPATEAEPSSVLNCQRCRHSAVDPFSVEVTACWIQKPLCTLSVAVPGTAESWTHGSSL